MISLLLALVALPPAFDPCSGLRISGPQVQVECDSDDPEACFAFLRQGQCAPIDGMLISPALAATMHRAILSERAEKEAAQAALPDTIEAEREACEVIRLEDRTVGEAACGMQVEAAKPSLLAHPLFVGTLAAAIGFLAGGVFVAVAGLAP